ncbi:hypothetical protein OW763_08475 [Clostridium aestuarii]|uniref:Uncharacterized protein n=1 Tax=Clostridium aestuarii TaxID=338193 RepID=A0ABT4CZH8_9CLOT|nr:hypothetical protein [Clostridium aestuarii]MCY6484391.1 hypothetical protein [Clostridium aestuarii]
MKKKVKNVVLKIILFIVCIIGVFAYLIFSKGDYKYTANNQAAAGSLLSILGEAAENEGKLELTQEDINNITSSYFTEPIKKGSLIVKDFNVNILNDKIIMFVPVEYKKLNLVLSTKGELIYDKKNLIYKPEYFKVGKLKLSKNMVLNNIQKYLAGKVIVENNNIKLNRDISEDDIRDVKINGDKLFLSVKPLIPIKKNNKEEKKQENIKITLDKTSESLKELQSKVKDEGNKQEIKKTIEIVEKAKKDINNLDNKKILDKIDEGLKNIAKNSKDKEVKDSINKIIKEPSENNNPKVEEKINKEKKDESIQKSLAKAKGDLGRIRSSVTTAKEKEMVDIMSSTVDNLMANPSYNFWGNVKRVKSIYKTLPPEQRKKFKNSLYSNTDMDNAEKLRGDLEK